MSFRVLRVDEDGAHFTDALRGDTVMLASSSDASASATRVLLGVTTEAQDGGVPSCLRVERDQVVVTKDGFKANGSARVGGSLSVGKNGSPAAADTTLDVRGPLVRLDGAGSDAGFRAFTRAAGGTDTSVASFSCVSGGDETDTSRTARFGCSEYPRRAFLSYADRECVAMDDRGFVGVSTRSPEAELDVAGRLRCRGAVHLGGSVETARYDTTHMAVRGDATVPHVAEFVSAEEGGGVVLCVANRAQATSSDSYQTAGRVGVCTAAPEHALHVNGDVYTEASYLNRSDARFKTDVEPIAQALEKVRKLRGYTFRYKEEKEKHAGLMAQEVREVLPESVREDASTGHLNLAYAEVVPLLVQAINELTARLEAYEKREG